jgi:hypothetical protein
VKGRATRRREIKFNFRRDSMIVQTNPEMFYRNRPIHTVTNIDRSKGVVTPSGSDGSSLDVRLDSWGHLEVTQPVIGSKVQLLDDDDKPGV